MFWVLQRGIFADHHLNAVVASLQRRGVPHEVVGISNRADHLIPEVTPPLGVPIYCYGSTGLCRLAQQRNWQPGAFHRDDQLNFLTWQKHLGDVLLNADATIGPFATLEVPEDREFFARPVEDNKAFNGRCFWVHEWKRWRDKMLGSGGITISPRFERILNTTLKRDTQVVVSSLKSLMTEWRCFVVNHQVVTGSQYRSAGRLELQAGLPEEVVAFAQKVISKWEPDVAYCLDICRTASGLKVVEYNGIGCSGLYSADADQLVAALEGVYD